MNSFPLPEDFKIRLTRQLSDDAETLFDTLEGDSPTVIRLHPNKQQQANTLPEGESVVWNEFGVRLSERPKFNLDPNYHAGLYYPMEASSMFLGHVLKQIELGDDALMLDLCAAPGGKTLILKDAFPNQLLVSNEIDAKRVHILRENAIRWGTRNHLIVNSEAASLQKANVQYDLILVDAPCSGEGLFRKDKKSRSEWTAERAEGCGIRQNQILDDVYPLLKPGGLLIYSTCTYNPQENMDQLERMANEFQMNPLPIERDAAWNIDEISTNDCFGYQFWPHRVQGEGFFIGMMQKNGADEPEQEIRRPRTKKVKTLPEFPLDLSDELVQEYDGKYFAFTEKEWMYAEELSKAGKVVRKGLYLGEIKGKDVLPSYDLAMTSLELQGIIRLELDTDQAVYYLKGNALHLQAEKGPVLLCHNGLAMGFGKSNGQRINNLLPKHLRIR